MTILAPATSTIVGALACQKDSYLRTLKTVVVGCIEKKPDIKKSKKKKGMEDLSIEDKPHYEIELEDTVLFPEGGGQPSDTGVIKDLANGKNITVNHVERDGLLAKHKTFEPIDVGSKVLLTVDWKKRFDHMQQHTGQHLISAILDTYKVPTLSWKMATGDSSLELINYLETPRKLSEEEVSEISETINETIIENLPISVDVPSNHEDIKTGKIPTDYDLDKGILRVIRIGELDSNPCCGTHLKTTGHVVAVSLLHQVNVRGTNSRLHFLCGDRVGKYARAANEILKTVGGTLSCQVEDIPNKVELMSGQLRKANGTAKSLLEDCAKYKSEEIISALNGEGSVVYEYFRDKGLDFLLILYKEISNFCNKDIKGLKKTVVLLTGDLREQGSLIVFGGQPAKVQSIANELKTKVASLKGGGKEKWQGKISVIEKGDIERVIEYLETL